MPLIFSPGIALIMMTFMVYLPGWLVETDVWLRLQAADSHREARKGVLIASLNSLIFAGILPAIIGLTALYLYPPIGSVIPERLQDGALIFSTLLQDYSPVWLNAFLAVGLVAAAMSTIDTCSNVVALSISYDLVEPVIQHHFSKERLNHLARWISVVAILLAFTYSLFTESLWDIFYLSSGILTTTVFLPVITSFLPGTKELQVNLAIIFGFMATILFYFLGKAQVFSNLEPAFLENTGLGYILWGFLAAVLGWLLGRIKFNQQRSIY
jgi:Na+/proline symporter